ncbi:MAG: CHAT domain-containing protein [Flavisolibacter sp.]
MSKKVFHFWIMFLSLCCFLFVSHSQKTESSYSHFLSDYRQADKIYEEASRTGSSSDQHLKEENRLNEQALSLFSSILKKLPSYPGYDSLRFYCTFKAAELQHSFDHLPDALYGYQSAIGIHIKSKLADSLLFKPWLYSGIIYYNQNRYDSAVNCFLEAEKIQARYGNKLEEIERLYNMMGIILYEKGDFRQSKNYFLKAIETLSPLHPYYKDLFEYYRINLAQIYFKLEDYEQSNRMYQQLLSFHPVNRNEIIQNIGLIHLHLGASTSALHNFRKVHYTGSKNIWLYQNMGEAFLNLGELDSATLYLNKAIALHHDLGERTDHLAYGQALKTLGDLKRQEHLPKESLNDYQKAIQEFYPAYGDSSIESNPQSFSGVFSYVNLFHTLVAKAEAFHDLYQQSSSIAMAREELSAYRSAFSLIGYVEKTYTSDEARLFLDRIKYEVHVKPIDIAFELYTKTGDKNYIESLYVFDQQNKASILSLKQQQYLQSSADTNMEKERNLRAEITRLSLHSLQLMEDPRLRAQLDKQIREDEMALGKLYNIQLSAAQQIPSISYLQNELLDDHTALVSFHLSSSSLTTLVIRKNKLSCYQQPFFAGFHEEVQDYINGLHESSDNEKQAEQSRELYHFLFGNIALSDIRRLIIVADDELNYLSFESLQDERGTFLVEKYSIQYQYSTSLLQKQTSSFEGHQTLAFAPFAHRSYFDSSVHLDELPNSVNELEGIKGLRFFDTAATKDQFLSHLEKYPVLHLATHAVVNLKNNDLSFVAFAPAKNAQPGSGIMYEEEIYNLPLHHTELVLLSACETGSGDLVKGEGIMSLSRAFSYAGCPNIITSLWNANDFSTAYLTQRIHSYLDKDYSIDEALRRAKLDYLHDRSVSPRLKLPFYWSHLIFIGNYRAERAGYLWIWIAGAVFVFLLIIGYFVRRRRS